MPRYEYTCECGDVQERRFLMAERPAKIPCERCGESATLGPGGGIAAFVKGRDFQFDKRKCIPSIGRNVRSDEAQGRLYEQMVGEAKKGMKQFRRNGGLKKTDGFELVGRVPLELHEAVVEHQDDKNVWNSDPVDMLKRTNMYLGDD
jgi:hypothetical protein